MVVVHNKYMIPKCYSSEKLIALNTCHEVVPPGTHFTAESTEAMRIKCLAQGHNILMPGFEPPTSVSSNRHPNHMVLVRIAKTTPNPTQPSIVTPLSVKETLYGESAK